MAKKQIILNADDYAACHYINNGIMEGVKMSKINSVSCFVTHARSKDDVLQLIDLKTQHNFQIGLHVSITCGYPITLCTTMKAGAGQPFYNVHEHDYVNIDTEELRTELKNQINLLQSWLDSKGAGKVDHLTVHHGVIYFFDRLFKVFWEVAKEYNIPIRSPLPWSKSNFAFKTFNNKGIPIKLEGLKNGLNIFLENLRNNDLRDRELLKMLKGQKKKTIQQQIAAINGIIRHPLCYTDTIYGQPYLRNLIDLIAQTPDNQTVEFMFHLGSGKEDAEIPEGINRNYFKWRKKELETLRQLDIAQIMRDYQVTTANYNSF